MGRTLKDNIYVGKKNALRRLASQKKYHIL